MAQMTPAENPAVLSLHVYTIPLIHVLLTELTSSLPVILVVSHFTIRFLLYKRNT